MAYTQNGESEYDMPLWLAAVHRLLLPTLFLLFGIAYFLNTINRFSLDNLRYPYFVLFILLLMIFLVLSEEIKTLYRDREKYDNRALYSIKGTWHRWKKPITIISYTFVYLLLIRPLGLVIATFLFFIGGMRIAGLRDWKYNLGLSTLMIIVIYLTFIILLDIIVPRGPLGF